MKRASAVACVLATLASGCILQRSGTGPGDGSTPPPGFDAGSFDGGSFDGGSDAGFDAGLDGGVDSAVPIPDACAPSAETCDGFDQDCDGVIDNDLVRTCTTTCGTGTDTCVMGSWFCDVREPTIEVCDNADNDCDGMVDELLTRTCSSMCGMGLETCTAGVFGPCSAPTPSPEVCDNADNDCNGMVDEGLDRPCTVTTACGTVTGTESCVGGSYTCVTPSTVDVCNGVDDDCDGTIDNGPACPCPIRYHGSHAYLFCTGTTNWNAALAACRASGYELVTVNDSTENTFVTNTALSSRNNDWWIGISDQRVEGTWEWAYGTSTYDRWDSGEPGNFSAGSFDCGNIENGSDSFETRGFWADRECDNSRPYVCESR